jgi:hypothetical protein
VPVQEVRYAALTVATRFTTWSVLRGTRKNERKHGNIQSPDWLCNWGSPDSHLPGQATRFGSGVNRATPPKVRRYLMPSQLAAIVNKNRDVIAEHIHQGKRTDLTSDRTIRSDEVIAKSMGVGEATVRR